MKSELAGCEEPPDLVVTTSGRPTPELLARAAAWGARLGVPVVARSSGLARLAAQHGVRGLLVVSPLRTTYYEPATSLEYFFHPGMLKVRLHNCQRGHEDPLLRAMALRPGDSVLDCTLGRATDAGVCAFGVGPGGRVLGLERSRVLAELTIDGLRHYEDASARLTLLLRRIEARCADYNTYLPTCADRSFTVVYFDPIFHDPLEASQSMAPLRALADPAPLGATALAEARRVAGRCVVVKQRKGTPLWAELGITEVQGSPASPVEYGVVTV